MYDILFYRDATESNCNSYTWIHHLKMYVEFVKGQNGEFFTRFQMNCTCIDWLCRWKRMCFFTVDLKSDYAQSWLEITWWLNYPKWTWMSYGIFNLKSQPIFFPCKHTHMHTYISCMISIKADQSAKWKTFQNIFNVTRTKHVPNLDTPIKLFYFPDKKT